MSRLIGAQDLITALARFGDNAIQMVKDETEASGRDIEADAKRLAPVHMGQLKQQINYQRGDNGLTAKVFANAPYSAYVEFGTRSKVSVPPEMQSIAIQYKGKGTGTFKNFVEDLKDWVRLKGIASGDEVEGVAYAIAISIMKNGVSPQPFLYPALVTNRKKYIDILKAELTRLTAQFGRR